MKDENFNPIIGVSISEIDNCDNLSILYEWENILLKKGQELKNRVHNKHLELSASFSVQKKKELLIMTDLADNIRFFRRAKGLTV